MATKQYRNKDGRNRGTSYYTYGNVAYELQPDYTPYPLYEEKRRKEEAAKEARAEAREQRISTAKMILMALVLFAGCLAFMGMHVLVANEEVSLRKQKAELADLKAGNAILEAEITEKLDMDYIKEEAVKRLGMAEPQPYQIVYIDVPRQGYTVQHADDEAEQETSVLEKISNMVKKD